MDPVNRPAHYTRGGIECIIPNTEGVMGSVVVTLNVGDKFYVRDEAGEVVKVLKLIRVDDRHRAHFVELDPPGSPDDTQIYEEG